jgi:hypothetical protein
MDKGADFKGLRILSLGAYIAYFVEEVTLI